MECAAGTTCRETITNWIHVRWESEFINPSSPPPLSLQPSFPTALLFFLTHSPSSEWKADRFKASFLANIHSIKSQGRGRPLRVSKGRSISKGPQNVMGFTGHNLFDMKWSSADTKWPPLGARQISVVLRGSTAQCQWWRTLLIFH